ncbi:similar to stage IV sporulation protein [Paenibacillus catalpae]|uniref:Similar to stage IV sporulation protein n=1 Tax=Paenibacillus catalpae TaxID=1045775 RepID=A0A1I2F635_9BACL|nr:sporulation protein YqfD [Paenibacillus catalpae]SFF00429.1 similar to stage IV sporulation protein [Paenibacillus catalpae]
MAGQWLQWIRGVVTVHIRGGQPEQLVNRALEGGLELSSIRWTSDGKLEFELSVGDFFRLRPFLKETGCRAHVTKREGMPFWLVRMEKRKFFAIGIAMFFIGIYLLSSLVWSIEVKGNVKLTEEQILTAAKREGIFPMQWSFRLKDKDVLSKELATDLPGATWVGVEKKGTRIIIQVVESTEPEKADPQNPRHLVASNDAVITEIYTEKGRPVVKKNMKVKKGQTLISGTIGGGAYTQTVVAKGNVRGLVWYEFMVASPLTQEVKVYTGEKKTKWYAVIGHRALQVSGYGKNPFDTSEDVVVEEQAVWRSWKLPFGRLKKTVMEVRTDVRELTEEEAKNNGMLQAKADVMQKAGNDAVILKEIVLHEKTENGKVYMKVLFEVEQSIVEEMPLVQMQGE